MIGVIHKQRQSKENPVLKMLTTPEDGRVSPSGQSMKKGGEQATTSYIVFEPVHRQCRW